MDMENAFHWVRHSFLFNVLRNFGCAKYFTLKVKYCIGSPWITPLVNGMPMDFFKFKRILRQ